MTGKRDLLPPLTFSQRYGYEPLPEPMRLEHIPQKFRQEVHRSIDDAITKDIDPEYDPNITYADEFCSDHNLGMIMFEYHYDVLGSYHDEIPHPSPRMCRTFFRMMVKQEPWNRVLNLIEFIIGHRFCSRTLYQEIIAAFDKAAISYFVDETGGRPIILPRASRESGEATLAALQVVQDSGIAGATTHLRQAAEHIDSQQYADAIADCIHAVVSIARAIDPQANKDLGPALNSLENAGLLKHPALKRAFGALYGYASDEKGIRKALVYSDAADVGVDEAIFMFGACASFAAYLTQKHRQAGCA